MTSLERVAAILQHREADRIPVYPLINSISRSYQNINYPTWSVDIDQCASSIIKATDDIGVDVICSLIDLSVEAADFGQELIYPEHDAARPDTDNRLIKDIISLKKLTPIDPNVTPRMSDHIRLCKTLVEKRGETHPVVAFVFGPLGVLSMLRGQAELFMDMIDDPSAVHQALDAISVTLEKYCASLLKTGVNAIMFDTLFASQSIISKQMWDDFEGPYIQKLARMIHDSNSMVMIHNCGNGVYFDVQIKRTEPEAISFFYPPDDCRDFEETKKKYGEKTTLMGYISPAWLMRATEEEIRAECRNEIQTCSKGGGFILATGCEYPSGLSADKAKIIVNEAEVSGKY